MPRATDTAAIDSTMPEHLRQACCDSSATPLEVCNTLASDGATHVSSSKGPHHRGHRDGRHGPCCRTSRWSAALRDRHGPDAARAMRESEEANLVEEAFGWAKTIARLGGAKVRRFEHMRPSSPSRWRHEYARARRRRAARRGGDALTARPPFRRHSLCDTGLSEKRLVHSSGVSRPGTRRTLAFPGGGSRL
jgi:hypothetical protein